MKHCSLKICKFGDISIASLITVVTLQILQNRIRKIHDSQEQIFFEKLTSMAESV